MPITPPNRVARVLDMDQSSTTPRGNKRRLPPQSAATKKAVEEAVKRKWEKAEMEKNKRKQQQQQQQRTSAGNQAANGERNIDDPYSSILKELADAVRKSPDKRDVVDKWCEVLGDNLRVLPTEMQYEARHMIDAYVMGLRRSLHPYTLPSPPAAANPANVMPTTKKIPSAAAGSASASTSVSAGNTSSHNHQFAPPSQPSNQNQNYLGATGIISADSPTRNYVDLSGDGPNNTSPLTTSLIDHIMGAAAAQYNQLHASQL